MELGQSQEGLAKSLIIIPNKYRKTYTLIPHSRMHPDLPFSSLPDVVLGSNGI